MLADTQVAYDPFTQTWLASTLGHNANGQLDTLNFAASTTSSAIDTPGNWNRYSFTIGSASCPNSTQPLFDYDQPILGYNKSWVAIDALCFDTPNASVEDNDLLLLIPNNLSTFQSQTIVPTIPNPGPPM